MSGTKIESKVTNKSGTAQVGAISKAQQIMWNFGEKSKMGAK